MVLRSDRAGLGENIRGERCAATKALGMTGGGSEWSMEATRGEEYDDEEKERVGEGKHSMPDCLIVASAAKACATIPNALETSVTITTFTIIHSESQSIPDPYIELNQTGFLL